MSALGMELVKFKIHPRIDIAFVDDRPLAAETIGRRRRKKGKISVKDRPPPTFWRPNPSCRGKGLGYAMGYPCSSASGEYWDGYGQYRRDTMRKGIRTDFLS
jgi:hypothetical protein